MGTGSASYKIYLSSTRRCWWMLFLQCSRGLRTVDREEMTRADVPASGIDENINKRWGSWQWLDSQEILMLWFPKTGESWSSWACRTVQDCTTCRTGYLSQGMRRTSQNIWIRQWSESEKDGEPRNQVPEEGCHEIVNSLLNIFRI